jgi:hypothetical protein
LKLPDTLKANKAELLLASLLILILLSPLIEEAHAGQFLLRIAALPVMISAVFYASASKVHRAIAIIVALAWFCLRFLVPNMIDSAWSFVLYGILLGLVTYSLLGHIFRATRIDRGLIASAMTVYLLLGAIWGALYLIIYLINPGAFIAPSVDPNYASVHFTYYSYATLTTLGFGDITPISPVARILSVTEAITGVFYMAILIARLISLFGKDLR